MRINQIFETDLKYANLLETIAGECSTFLRDSFGLPVFKALPSQYKDIQKVKVRKHRLKKTEFGQTFNEAFEDQFVDLRERAVFTNSQIFESNSERDLFYVFPKNGYKFMYCTEVTHSTNDYKLIYETLFNQFEHEKAEQLIRDLLQFNYTHENLYEGIEKQVEVIFYNVPYYYAARVDVFEYNDLLTNIAEISDT